MSGDPLRVALFGHPLGHSRSRELFDALAAAGGARVAYEPVDVAPAALGGALARLREGAWDGANVTIPHKEAAAAAADDADALARGARAANVLLRGPTGALRAANTDGPAFLDALARHLGVRPRRAVVLGAGGAARAVALSLASAGAGVTVIARDPVAARGRFAGPDVPLLAGWDDPGLPPLLAAADLVVQATSLGTWPALDTAPPVPWHALGRGTVAVDLVYNPWETRFLREVRARGLAALNGWPMLVLQAARALELWLGPGQGDALVRAAGALEPRDPTSPAGA